MSLPPLLAWIEAHLIVLGLVAVLAGLALGILCGEYQARRARAAARPKRVRPVAKPAPAPARSPTVGKPVLQPALERDGRARRLVAVHHLHPVAEKIAPVGPRHRGRVPTPRAR
jgi:hypothetical protein